MNVEIVLDEPDFFRLTRVGNWYHALDYETGEGEWYHTADSLNDWSPYIIAAIGAHHDKTATETHAAVRSKITQDLHSPSAPCPL